MAYNHTFIAWHIITHSSQAREWGWAVRKVINLARRDGIELQMHEKDALMLQAEQLGELASPGKGKGKGGGRVELFLTFDGDSDEDDEEDEDESDHEEGEVVMVCPTKVRYCFAHLLIILSLSFPFPTVSDLIAAHHIKYARAMFSSLCFALLRFTTLYSVLLPSQLLSNSHSFALLFNAYLRSSLCSSLLFSPPHCSFSSVSIYFRL
jgi:hypothetical protein